MKKKIIVILAIMISILIFGAIAYKAPYMLPHEVLEPIRFLRDFQQEFTRTAERNVGIPLKAQTVDSTFMIEEFVTGLSQPTTMTFMGNDILILEKNKGTIRLIKNGQLQTEPVLDLSVSNTNEQGLLGILGIDSTVYLYFTEAKNDGDIALGNHIYKYKWDGSKLFDPKLVTELPSKSLWHNGGILVADSDKNVYAVIGDQTSTNSPLEKYRILQNYQSGELDDTGVIIKVGLDESITKPRDTSNPMDHYYAMGIRNSFGLAIDPITGHMWDTENGPELYDEVNLVLPNSNSGWVKILGPSQGKSTDLTLTDHFEYSDPEFTWELTVVPTALIFPVSPQFEKYNNSLFVANCLGDIYNFKLNQERTAFVFNDEHLSDLVSNKIIDNEDKTILEPMTEIIFGSNFGCITDLKFGPDGALYIVSLSDNIIYKMYKK
ncbi:sorbosone dehydrogenase family protein [Nitrosarchaeum sp. AC2]|uniref:PQQ-dependent sugar dehydrogenase n=1 Tax=Nitrosarchaeum sp. AC2 TaxID=2259673 RepID=UPI0015C7A5AA|nr:PQQ-dependent sugar dehydrogenase [Nitrosarchaeum sp. AC2]QLH10221.1 hypothetical protein DSQ20_00885 [Nitrosarchaeum sp. AC2]